MQEPEIDTTKIIEKLGDPHLNTALFDEYISRLEKIKAVQR